MSAPKTLREAARDLTLMSDDGSEYEHNDACQGEPECPACWVEGIRRLFADFPDEAAPVAVPDSDPTKAAIDVIAREVAEQMLDPMDLGDLWSDYPEIGEDDWRDVVVRVRDLAEAAKPDVDTYKTAYAHLQGRAEAWAAENDPA